MVKECKDDHQNQKPEAADSKSATVLELHILDNIFTLYSSCIVVHIGFVNNIDFKPERVYQPLLGGNLGIIGYNGGFVIIS
jgi:hypothetical protein